MANTIGSFVVAVVCDGMGGAKAGSVASQIATQTFLDTLQELLVEEMDEAAVVQCGLEAAERANNAVFLRSQSDKNCSGMGTTLVAAVVRDAHAYFFNVGDSRAYCVCAGGIRVITRDHSLVQDMLEHGDITAEQARSHPNRNLITRALGTECSVECDSFTEMLHEGDYLLLCSDGLINTVSDQEILYEVVHAEPAETCLERLFSISMERGASDNVTAILMQYEKEAEE